MMRNLRGIGNELRITLPKDENGFTSRKCPNSDCGGIFKIKTGTGRKGANLPCHCPYCGYETDMSDFNTPEQIEYAKSVAINQITNAIQKDVQDWGRELERSTKHSFIKMSVDYRSQPHPIRYYQEKQLETFVTCDVCALEYAIFGVFAFCPDCGTHNSMQILNKNLELAEKEIGLAGTSEDIELGKRLIEDALENVVSAFDGFGRATCAAYANKALDGAQTTDISFQNIEGARRKVQALFHLDLADGIEPDSWRFVVRCFQKRHLVAHTMGVIDQEYVKKTQDPQAVRGRKITLAASEVTRLAGLLKIIGNSLVDKLK
jgi:hypothetical protein